MNIREFSSKYCQDIIKVAKRRCELFDSSGFSFDEIIKDEDGREVRVINTTNYQIPLEDILGLDRSEFSLIWPYSECLEAYDTYVSNLIIIEGEEALNIIRNALSREMDKISRYDNIPEAFR